MGNWREKTRRVIFEADTPGGKAFDVALLFLITFSVLLVMAESIHRVRGSYATELRRLEWIVTGLFTVEYLARLATVERPLRYARSFYGVIDFMAVVPVYLSVLVPEAQSLLVVRSLRLLRVFRVFKMAQWLSEASYLIDAVRASARKIAVFLVTVILVNVVVGSTMYVIEGPENGFDNMFTGVYWSIVTMSTVGFGDIAPVTSLGQFLASALMLLGYGIIAVPTGIVSSEITAAGRATEPRPCPGCGVRGHEPTAAYCRRCGHQLT